MKNNYAQPDKNGHLMKPLDAAIQDLYALHALLDRLHAIATDAVPRAIRRPRLQELTGISRSHVYAMLDEKSPAFDPTFPRPFHLGSSPNSPTVWWESEVVNWLRSKAEARALIHVAG